MSFIQHAEATEHQRLEKLRQVCEKYEISPDNVKKLRQYEGKYEIIIIGDNSGSMMQPAHDPAKSADAFSQIPSRWEEFYRTLCAIVEVSSCLDKEGGLEIHFLNPIPGHPVDPVTGGCTISNVGASRDPRYVPDMDIDPYFNAANPHGHTPLSEVFTGAVNHKLSQIDPSQNLLVFIATDGEPTDRNGHVDEKAKHFEYILKNRPESKRVFVEIMALTDDKTCIGYLNRIDNIKGVDTTDDYYSEREEVQKHKGKSFKFSFGDYIVKCLLGSVDKSMDNIDKGECTIN
jgi:hypothetical protein